MRTLIKMTYDRNCFLSTTLGKFTFLDRNVDLDQFDIKANEYWVVDIVKEVVNGTKGCFWAQPIRKLEGHPINLVPGTFSIEYHENIAIVIPKEKSDKWIFQRYNRIKYIDKQVSAVVVDLSLSGSIDFERTFTKKGNSKEVEIIGA